MAAALLPVFRMAHFQAAYLADSCVGPSWGHTLYRPNRMCFQV